MRELLRLITNKRFRQIINLFGTFALQFWWLNKIKRFMKPETLEQKHRQLYCKQAKKFTAAALEAQGLLIKLGQFFSSRVDILPEEYTQELSQLQDAVRPVETDTIIKRIEQEMSKSLNELFADFTKEPIAAASFGQVHAARLPTGEKVAVKILRPGIEKIVQIDLEALKLVTSFAKRYRRIANAVDLDQVYLEFKETILEELDYRKEAGYAETFANNFADDESIAVPKIFWSHTTGKVLTMEFVQGIKINEFKALEQAGLDRRSIAAKLLSSYLKQVLLHGFFHADPHPGNIWVSNDGTLVYLDFGMVGRVDPNMKDNMMGLAIGAFKNDPGAVVDAFDKLGFLRPLADRATLTKSVKIMLANLTGESENLKNINFNEFAVELRELIYSQPFQLPARTTFLGKALVTIAGLCNGLDPEFDLVKVAKPYFEQFITDETTESGQIFFKEARKTLTYLIAIPEKFNRLVNGLESGEIKLQPAKSFEEKLLSHQSALANRVVNAVLTVGFLLAGTQFLLAKFYHLGYGLLAIAGILIIRLWATGNTQSFAKKRRMRNLGLGFKKPRFHP